MKSEKLEVVRGSGNVFHDLGHENAVVQQLKAILAAADAVLPPPPTDLRSSDLDLINPSRWSVS